MTDRANDVPFAGTMMDVPLLLKSIVERAESVFGSQVVISYGTSGPTEATYAHLATRVRRVASALVGLGVRPGDRVATFLWNTQEHLELCLAVPSIGAVIHPLNVRLHTSDLEFVIGHAGDSVVVVDAALMDRLPQLDSSIRVITVGPSPRAGDHGLDYEQLVESGDPGFTFPVFSEDAACTLCYTSGTTGNPKGVVYTHRSTVLHTILESLPDYYAISEGDVVLPVVPIFHANAWGLPYATLMAGGRLVLAGSHTDPETIVRILSEQRVTFTGGVPTIWHGVGELEVLPDLTSLRMIVAGGTAVPESLLSRFDDLGLPLFSAYGMTETNPFLSIGKIPPRSEAITDRERAQLRLAQGRPIPLVDVRVHRDSGDEIQVRGATITARYYDASDDTTEKFTDDGWLRTGDVAEIRDDGILRIVDRTKDMIKSGGEWIPSVELEGAILSHPAVSEAAVVGISDDHWGERPAAFVVVRAGHTLDAVTLQQHIAENVARWWIPDLIQFEDSLPKTAVGKIDKKAIRARADDRPQGLFTVSIRP